MHSILWIAFAGYAFSQLITKCRDDNHYFISLPYTTNNSQILSATAGSCDENSTEVAGLQDFSAGRYNVTIDIERCGLNTETYSHPKVAKKALYMANVTNLKLGRRGNGMDYVYLDMNIATECGRQMQYTVTHTYGSIATSTLPVGPNDTDTDSSTHVLPGALEKFEFKFLEFTNASFNDELNTTQKRQAGTKAFIAIEAQNMNPDEYTFTVPDCMVKTSTNKSQALFSKVGEKNSFIDLLTRYRTIGQKQQFLLSHIYFVLDRSTSATYSLTCTVKVCPKNFMGDKCSVLQSCSSNPCVHGTCTDSMTWQTNANTTDYTCTCDANYEGTNCDQSSTAVLDKIVNGEYEQFYTELGPDLKGLGLDGDVAWAVQDKKDKDVVLIEYDLIGRKIVKEHIITGARKAKGAVLTENLIAIPCQAGYVVILNRTTMAQISKVTVAMANDVAIENDIMAVATATAPHIRVFNISDPASVTPMWTKTITCGPNINCNGKHITMGKGLVAGTFEDKSIRVYESSSGDLKEHFSGHKGPVYDAGIINSTTFAGTAGDFMIWSAGQTDTPTVKYDIGTSKLDVNNDLVYITKGYRGRKSQVSIFNAREPSNTPVKVIPLDGHYYPSDWVNIYGLEVNDKYIVTTGWTNGKSGNLNVVQLL